MDKQRYNSDKHHRRTVRLHDYDYSQAGLYFVTICAQNHECLFGDIVDDKMILNETGQIVHNEWLRTAELRPNVRLHNFVVMPNHFHAILEIMQCENSIENYVADDDNGGDGTGVGARRALPLHETTNAKQRTNELPQSRFQNQGKNTLSSIIGSFKSSVTKNVHGLGLYFAWQRNLWEHIIRNYGEYARIADYIDNNPMRWTEDRFYKQKYLS
jgi:REP element-mobilizing transposase RayT